MTTQCVWGLSSSSLHFHRYGPSDFLLCWWPFPVSLGLIFVVRLFMLHVRIFLRIPQLPRGVLWVGCIVHIANCCRLMTANDAKYNGCHCSPAAFMSRKIVGVWPFWYMMSNLSAAEVLAATYGCGPWSEWIWAELVGLRMPRECVMPGGYLCSI